MHSALATIRRNQAKRQSRRARAAFLKSAGLVGTVALIAVTIPAAGFLGYVIALSASI